MDGVFGRDNANVTTLYDRFATFYRKKNLERSYRRFKSISTDVLAVTRITHYS